MSVSALPARTQRRVAIAAAAALVFGGLAVLSQPAQAAVEYGGVTLVDSTGEIVAGASVELETSDPLFAYLTTDQTGTADIASEPYYSTFFADSTEATVRVTLFNGTAGEYQTFYWTGAALEQNAFDTASPLAFVSGSATLLELELPVDLPSGAITGSLTPTPPIPVGEEDLFTASMQLFADDGTYLFDYRSGGDASGSYRVSGLPNGTYYAQFTMGGTSASFPVGYASTFYESSLTLQAATPIVVSGGAVTTGINQAVFEKADLTGVIRRATPSGSVPVLAGPGEVAKPAVSLYPVGSSPTAADALQQYTFSNLEFGTGGYSYTVPAGSYKLAFGVLTSGSGNAGFTAYQYYNGKSTAEDAQVLVLPGGVETTVNALYPGFGDVPGGNQFIDEITWLASTGISTGYGDGTFRPLNSVNRDAMAAFLYRYAGEPDFTPPVTSPFTDVTPSTQFYKEITWLASTGITTGYPDNTFRPLAPVGRDAMAAFLYRFAEEPAFTPPGTSPFTDVPTVNQFYKEIAWLASTGVSTGYPDSTFRPVNSVARDAMAAFLFRYSGLIF